ncbi:type IV secretory system conjugative DNA transfer family protein [Nocardia flavorosea]|uniref:type IV secretory system conjugative DNA transfer family protein n=1 Tax=Nocardia flavorosea TaxID=53429 RepID=UPI002455A826|nr:TraM recognition domain-containing protein [Nocardia flavorosea]
MDRSMKQPGSTDMSAFGPLIATVGGFGAAGAANMSLRIGEEWFGGPAQDPSWNPIILGLNLMTGDLEWTTAATGGAVTLGTGTALAAVGSIWAWRAGCRKCKALYRDRGRIRKESIDSQARYMAKGKELAGLGLAAVRAKAEQLGVQLRAGDAPGVLIGRAVLGGKKLYASYEDLHLDIWGPRQGKSTSRVIPAVLEAPGAVVATSNKRDVVDATRALRSREDRTAWVFDPQGVAGEVPSWYWDPLGWVRDGGVQAQVRAAELAGHFAAGGEASSKDAFFDPEGEDLLAALFLAAALAEMPITQVYRWVTKSDDKTPIKLLDKHGQGLLAAGLSDQYYSPEKQRGGVFSTAKKMAACLKYSHITPWVTAPEAGEAPRKPFTVGEFVRSRDTLYPLSQEGKGSAGPLLVALCHAIGKEGMSVADRTQGGRLPVPMTLVLDEAANIVKWADLPAQYSHFGSRGIVVITILQSWSQGVRCWGPEGMKAMWSASNIKVLGSGIDEQDFLEGRAQIIGNHYEQSTSLSKGRDSRSTTLSRITEPTLTASDLGGMPRGRVVVFSAGRRPTLCQSVPWMERPYAAEVRAALADIQYSPKDEVTRPQLRVVPSQPDSDEEEKSA